ncbi:MAG: hypothetical protein ACOZB0_04560 [Pseudomonadota bacterium]
MFTDARIAAMLDTELVDGDKLSLHSAYSATGANEISGGSYARQTIDWAAAASRAKATVSDIDVPVPAGSTVGWLGVWDSTGTTFRGMAPNGGSARSYQVDLTNNKLLCEGHGLLNGMRAVVQGSSAPGGLTTNTAYWVVGVTAGDPDTLQLAATEGGAAIDLTSQPSADGTLSRIVLETYGSDGTHRVNSLSVAL